MQLDEYFKELKGKDILCWGEGKHFRNLTYPFLVSSGLVDNLKGFVEANGSSKTFGDVTYPCMKKADLENCNKNTILLISVVGYQEILSQLAADPKMAEIDAYLVEDTMIECKDHPWEGERGSFADMIF